MLFDIGANLTHKALRPHYQLLLDQARDKGITDVSITAVTPANTRLALAMIEAYAGPVQCSTTAGIHPHLAEQYNKAALEKIRRYARIDQVKAIGETGLDYFRMLADKKAQQKSFCSHLEVAIEVNKPVFLHQRDSHQDFLPILKEYIKELKQVIVHCFTDTRDALHAYLELGCSIGITGWISDIKRGEGIRQLVADIPDDKLMIETDAPYLLPPAAKSEAFHGRHNVPQLLPFVLQTVAENRQQSTEHVAACTTKNALAFFSHTQK